MDPSGNIVVVGNTGGNGGNNYVGLPVVNAIPTVGFAPNGGTNDGFIAYFNNTDPTATFLSYFGSTQSDQIIAVTTDAAGGIIAVGTTDRAIFPGTPHPLAFRRPMRVETTPSSFA